MALFARLMHTESPGIGVHQFMAALGEYERGKMTAQQVYAAFNLSAGEQVEAAALMAKILPPRESLSLGGYTLLTNVGTAYDATNASRGLGICRVECAGINAFEFGVSVGKVGSGTQSWQLWDETNGAEVARLDDSGAAGDRQASTTANFSPALGAGIRTLRVRAKSTVGADDPHYYGATLLIQRIGLLTAEVLHEVLCLAEARIAPYTTVEAVQTRLGV